mgnify:FL=1
MKLIYEYLPFGGGNRRCIGYAFAEYQIKLILATIISKYQLQLSDNRPIYPVRSGPGLGPSRDIWMTVITKSENWQRSLERM